MRNAFYLIVLSIALNTVPTYAQEKPVQRILHVTGRGTASAPVAFAEVRLGVEVSAKTAGEAQKEVAKRASAVIDFLKSKKVENLQTVGLTLTPVYDYSKSSSTRETIAYRATNDVLFRSPINQVGLLMDESVKAGATKIESVTFVPKAAEAHKARLAALKDATKNAKDQSNAVLAALGLSEKEVISIQIMDQSIRPVLTRMEVESTKVTSPVEASDQVTEATIAFEIRY